MKCAYNQGLSMPRLAPRISRPDSISSVMMAEIHSLPIIANEPLADQYLMFLIVLS